MRVCCSRRFCSRSTSNFKPRILAVNRAQDFPVVERIAERTLLFVMVRPRDDGVHQIALVFDQPQGALEVSFIGMLIPGLL